ncbi:HAD family phosphatase [Corallococcus sp. CA047B]|uniref:HAD family hydrolase n=1 Tax=Corallococcus sp. CA047B TaxID=2316729 RepID=UPI000EA30253|nr:HAD family phosphatase [Corallococcus sp. CA047B]RKH14319.1 HAD family phosphatase [Corallococcus sp. CA047B]
MSPSTSNIAPFDAVLFDLDGVVIDTTELHYRVWEDFARERGYTPTREELLATNGRRAGETLRAWFGAALSDEEVEALTYDREMAFHRLLEHEPVSAVPGVGAYLRSLGQAGVPWALGTSALADNAELALERVGLQHLFPVRVTSTDVTRGKPHPEVYLKAASALGVAPGGCVVFEDAVAGLRAARAAGAACVAVATSFPRDILVREQPDFLVKDFRDLPAPLRPGSAGAFRELMAPHP